MLDKPNTYTHWGRDKIASILQPVFSNPFSSLKLIANIEGFNQQYGLICSDKGLAPNMWTDDKSLYEPTMVQFSDT